MDEVSCRTIAPMLAALAARGIPLGQLVEGAGVELSDVTDPRQRIDWDAFAVVCERLEQLLGTDALPGIGFSAPNTPAFFSLVAIVGWQADPAMLYRVLLRIVGPALLRPTRSSFQDLGGGHFRCVLHIPRPYRDIPQLYRICEGGLRANPVLSGRPPAQVTTSIGRRRAVYDVQVDIGGPGLFRRSLGWLGALLRVPLAIAEIASQRDEIGAAHLALRDAERRVRRQRRRIRRAEHQRREAHVARERAEAYLQQSQRLESLGVLAGGIAHDFNNLLASIRGNAEIALLLSAASPALQPPIERIQRATERGAELTAQLLTYAGRQPIVAEPLDVTQLVRDIHGLMRTAVPRSVIVHENLAEDLPAVTGDPAQFQQIVMNLLSNAAAAVEGTRGEVWLRTARHDVDAARIAGAWVPTEAAPGEFVSIEVEDNGVGIDPEALPRIFEPFFSTRPRGRGLGLAALLGIVRTHGGVVEVCSTLGRGSTFRVLFPSRGSPTQAAVLPPRAVRGSGTVLLVDDDSEVRDAIGELLVLHGFEVISASGGVEALALARRHGTAIDTYLLDRAMPGMSGPEVFRGLRAMRRDARVFLYSGLHDEAECEQLRGEGLAGVLTKPIGAAALVEALSEPAEALSEPAEALSEPADEE